MIVKKENKNYIIPFLIIVILFYISLRITTATTLNDNIFNIELLNNVINNIHRIDTPLLLNAKNIGTSIFISFFGLMVYESFKLQNKENIQKSTYGTAEWKNAKDIKDKTDKVYKNNMILTKTELISKNMNKSKMNRHVLLVGRPGTGKSYRYFKPNILNANRWHNNSDRSERRTTKGYRKIFERARIHYKSFEFR